MKADISIIIPVINEQTGINQTIKKIYHQAFSGILEVIVVDGHKDGTTISCIENREVIKLGSAPGRSFQMNSGARTASGRILLFLHCDTVLPENALESVQGLMVNHCIKAGAFDLSIDKKGFVYRIIEKTASLRSRITKIPYGDQAIFIRQDYFFKIGQYREIAIMEDVDLMLRIKKDKARFQFLNNCALTSPRRWEKEGVIFTTIRNWTILTMFFSGIKPEKLAGFYKKHKDG